MHRGYIKLWRKLQDHEFWKEHREFSKWEAWQYLLLKANHAPSSVMIGNKIVSIERGQLMRSLGSLSTDWRWGVKRVRLFLTLCQEMKMIETKGGTIATQITICNYDTYQDSGQEKDTIGASLGQAWGKLRATEKNEKNEKNEKKKEKTPLPPKQPGGRGRRVEYAPDTGPDGLPQIGPERSELYRGIAHEWWRAHKNARGRFPVWLPTYDSAIKRLVALNRPIEEYRNVFVNGLLDCFHGPSLSFRKCEENFNELLHLGPRTRPQQSLACAEEPRRDLRHIIAEQTRAMDDNDGY